MQELKEREEKITKTVLPFTIILAAGNFARVA
jgi:hypothetical protein